MNSLFLEKGSDKNLFLYFLLKYGESSEQDWSGFD